MLFIAQVDWKKETRGCFKATNVGRETQRTNRLLLIFAITSLLRNILKSTGMAVISLE